MTTRSAALVSLLLLIAAASAASENVFLDMREGSGIDFVHSFGDTDMSNLVESSGVGLCLFDYDGDGLLDIYFLNGAVLPEITDPPEGEVPKLRNRLYRNLGGWKFEDVTAATGVGDDGFGMGCLAGDLDNDGDADLMITNYGKNRVFRNDRGKAFTDVTDESGLGDEAWSLGATLIDLDRDGLLDVYVGNYVVFDPAYRAYYVADRFPGPLSYPGSPDHLYRNLGGWRFEDVTEKSGIGRTEGRAMGVSSVDYNNDGLTDIFVANDAMANSLYRNLGDGRFEEVALVAGVAFGENGDATAAMGADFGDFNGDGLWDVVVPDMTFNALYQASPGELFRDVSRLVGVAPVAAQFVTWSGHFVDFDNDGRLDLFLSTGDLHYLEPQEDLLLRNDGNGRFVDVSAGAGEYFGRATMGRGAAVGDLDNDGDEDVVLNLLSAPPVLLRNDRSGDHHWLTVRALDRHGRDAIGARITLETVSDNASRSQMREVRAGSGYISCGDPRAHFGLGKDTVRQLTVRWPSGKTETLDKVTVDRFLTVEEKP